MRTFWTWLIDRLCARLGLTGLDIAEGDDLMGSDLAADLPDPHYRPPHTPIVRSAGADGYYTVQGAIDAMSFLAILANQPFDAPPGEE